MLVFQRLLQYNSSVKDTTILEKSITGNEEHISISRAEYDALKAENTELNQKLDYLMG